MSASVNADVTLEPFSGSVGLNPIAISGGLTVDAGLDDIVIQGNPANPIALQAIGDPAKPIGLELGLDDIKVSVAPLTLEPMEVTLTPLTVTLTPLTITLTPVQMDLKLEPVKIDLGLDNMNMALALAITDFPRMKVSAPLKMDFGVGLLGIPLMNFSLCGEAGMTTDDNPPQFTQTVFSEEKTVGPGPGRREEPFRVVIED